MFFAVNCLVFWWLSRVTHAAVADPGHLRLGRHVRRRRTRAGLDAGQLRLTTREAKRLYGFIGSGATAGWIVGGYLTQVTVKRFGAEATLVGIAISLMVSALLVSRIWRRRTIVDGEITASRRVIGTSSIWTSLKLIATSPYLKAIAAVILLSSYTTAVAGWQFKAIASHSITGRNELAAFFGQFNFYAGIIAFCLQWLLTGRLLRKFGLAFALFVVPVGLTLGSIGLLTFKSLAAVIALRGIDQILRYSIDKPTVELLYLPVSAQETNAVKSFIDTVVWRLGDGLAGATILIAASLGQMAAVQVTWVNLVLLGGWLVRGLGRAASVCEEPAGEHSELQAGPRARLDHGAGSAGDRHAVASAGRGGPDRGALCAEDARGRQLPLYPSGRPRSAVARRSPRSGGRRFGCWTKAPTPGPPERWRKRSTIRT